MANKLLEILIRAKDETSKGFSSAGKNAGTLQRTLGGVKGALIGLGFTFAASEALQFASATEQAARELDNAKSKLIPLVGGVDAYNALITDAQSVTRGMVAEVDIANSAFITLEMGLAKNADEAVKLANAGNILSQAFASQGASVELFNRLLASGNQVLLDNFGISTAQVNSRKAELMATENLSEAEARLQAIRDIAIAKADGLASTMTEAQLQTQQFEAASKNLAATIGEFLVPAFEGTKEAATNAMVATDKFLNQYQEKAATAAKNHAAALSEMAMSQEEFNNAVKSDRTILLKYNEAIQVATATEQRRADFMPGYIAARRESATVEAELAQATEATVSATERAINAQTARYQGLAESQMGEVEKLMGDTGRVTPDELAKSIGIDETAITETFRPVADNLASQLSGAVNTAFSQVAEVVPGMEGLIPEAVEPGEFARRMGALQDGLQDSDQVFLEAFKAQAGGNPIYSALLQAIEQGDSEGVAAEANALMSNNLAAVMATGVVDSLRAQMQEQQLAAQVQQIVAEELGQQPIEGTMPIVTNAVGDVTEAQGEVTTGMTDIQTAADNAAEAIQTGFANALTPVNTIIERLTALYNLLGDIETKADNASGAIAGLNPPGGDAASNIQLGGDPLSTIGG